VQSNHVLPSMPWQKLMVGRVAAQGLFVLPAGSGHWCCVGILFLPRLASKHHSTCRAQGLHSPFWPVHYNTNCHLAVMLVFFVFLPLVVVHNLNIRVHLLIYKRTTNQKKKKLLNAANINKRTGKTYT
jgi:hypothetical protein